MAKSRLLALGLAVTGLAGAVALGNTLLFRGALPTAAEHSAVAKVAPAGDAPAQLTDKQKVEKPTHMERSVRVEAPLAEVNVDKERGRVRVKAPHTEVRVDPDQGRVRVRAPYVDLDIRW